MNFKGIIIEESLEDKGVLTDMKILSTNIEPVVAKHQTPWINQWTLHDIEVPSDKADEIANRISKALDREHNWYADYKTDKEHYIIYRDKVFHITDRADKEQYGMATAYGIAIGIPAYQVDFAPEVAQWER